VRAALCSAAGLLAGTALIIVATSLQGVSLGSLVWGVILNPPHQPDLFSVALGIGRRKWFTAIILITGVVGLGSSGRFRAGSRWLDILRCAAGIGSILLLPLWHRIQWVVPLLPLTLIPQSTWEREAAGVIFSRIFITCMAVTQFLEPYPVAGSQMGIAAAPMILWAFLCLVDGIAGLRTSWPGLSYQRKGRWAAAPYKEGNLHPGSGADATSFARAPQKPGQARQRWRLDAVIGGAILMFFSVASMALSFQLGPRSAWAAFKSGMWPVSRFPAADTGLRGSEWLHLPPEQATRFESIARSVGTNCSILFTMPGMASFNIWSGVPTPDGWNLTGWMKGISPERQAEILGILKANSRACAILNRPLVRFWDSDERAVAALPLARYVMTDMPKITGFGEYEIRVNPHRLSPWLPSP
jgi:hypothetical protein